jgi:hypothetical protein
MYRAYFAPNYLDPTGTDIYVETSEQVGGLHKRVCVDTWNDCLTEKTGKYCISFGVDNGVGSSQPTGGAVLGGAGYSSARGQSATGTGVAAGGVSTVGADATSQSTSGQEAEEGKSGRGSGIVYEDDDPVKEEIRRQVINCPQIDLVILKHMKMQLGNRGPYVMGIGPIPSTTCRDYSEDYFDNWQNNKEALSELCKQVTIPDHCENICASCCDDAFGNGSGSRRFGLADGFPTWSPN